MSCFFVCAVQLFYLLNKLIQDMGEIHGSDDVQKTGTVADIRRSGGKGRWVSGLNGDFLL